MADRKETIQGPPYRRGDCTIMTIHRSLGAAETDEPGQGGNPAAIS